MITSFDKVDNDLQHSNSYTLWQVEIPILDQDMGSEGQYLLGNQKEACDLMTSHRIQVKERI